MQPGPDKGLQWAWAWVQISEAQAQGSSLGFDPLWSSMQIYDQKGNIILPKCMKWSNTHIMHFKYQSSQHFQT
jgi:hypothetical protein